MGSEDAQNASLPETEVKEWTWQEISKHDTQDSCWIYVNEDVYDVTTWLPRHPGGEELILLFGGRDCTQAMDSYHPFTDKANILLDKYKIGRLKGPSEMVRYKPDTGFYKEVCRRVTEYFKERNIDPVKQTVGYELYRFISSIGGLVFGLYLVLKVFRDWNIPFLIRLLGCIPIAGCGIMVVINITHTSSHVPAFHLPRLNYYLGWLSFDVCLGCSYDIWSHEHVVGHHQYTNVIEVDPNGPDGDDGFELFRGSPNQKWANRFYYQFIWLPLISFLIVWDYRISSIRFWTKGYRKGIRVGSYYLTKRNLFVFLLGKFLYLFRTYYVPIVYWKAPWWEVVITLAITELIAGYILGLSLPAGHYTTNVAWPTIRVDEKTGHRVVDAEWAVIQCETTKDYAINSLLFNNCFGALNNHSCHHLFPAIHHTYYEEIYPIVKQTCKDYNVRIPDVETYSEFMRDYIYNLWDMGFDPKKLM